MVDQGCGPAPDVCEAPGPCTLTAAGVVCWEYDESIVLATPSLHFEVCGLQDGTIDLGCYRTGRREELVDIDGVEHLFIRLETYVAPVRRWDVPSGSLVTVTVKGCNAAGCSFDAALIDLVPWPEVATLGAQESFSRSEARRTSERVRGSVKR